MLELVIVYTAVVWQLLLVYQYNIYQNFAQFNFNPSMDK